jgi:hypothetical protein
VSGTFFIPAAAAKRPASINRLFAKTAGKITVNAGCNENTHIR